MLVGHYNAPDGRAALASDHGAPGKEHFVEAVGEPAEVLENHVFVLDEVVVPLLDGVCVMNSLVSYTLHFKATTLKLANVPEEWARSISSREDVLSHEVAPDEVFVLPITT